MVMDVGMRAKSSKRKSSENFKSQKPGAEWVKRFRLPHWPRFLTTSASVNQDTGSRNDANEEHNRIYTQSRGPST